MDTEVQVEDRIDDGRMLLEHLTTAGFQIAVAFWVKPREDGVWRLYIAPAGFSHGDRSGAHAKVYDILDQIRDTTISPLDITLLDPASAEAEAVAAIRVRTSTRPPRTYHVKKLGDLSATEAYIYPPIATPLRQEFIVTYVKRSEPNDWAATTRWGDLNRGMTAKGAVSYSTASWLGEQAEEPKFAHIRVLVEVSPEFDDPALLKNPVVAFPLLDQARNTADEAFKARHPDAIIKHDRTMPVAG